MHQLLSMGAVNGLPEDIQWAIRMLLPRKEDVQASAETAVKPAEAALSQLVPSTAYLPYLLQPQQLAVLTQHAQQVNGLLKFQLAHVEQLLKAGKKACPYIIILFVACKSALFQILC